MKIKDVDTNIEKFKTYLAYLPIVSGVLIFLGFLNYDFYYRKLEINIFNFLDASELIFSFVNLIYPIILSGIALNIKAFLPSEKIKKSETSVELENDNIEDLEFDYTLKYLFFKIRKFITNVKEKRFDEIVKDSIVILIVFFIRVVIIILWLFCVFFFLYFLLNLVVFDVLDDEVSIFNKDAILIPISFVWLFLIFGYLSKKFKENGNKLGIGIIVIITLLVLISNLNIYQGTQATKTNNDLNVKNVRFNYNGKNINTSDSKSLIGVTKNYLFLRETSKNENLIYKVSNITDMVFYYDDSLREKD
ncbi:hypothetical protein [Polaribacter aestuariivivens]|uniref:hypothetical protein n=1 Tax=Polaribacter aestuariivivens TaxID=2304626 RepID=UPI003F49616E